MASISYRDTFEPVLRYGEGGIRTHETVAGSPVFKTGAFNHSTTSPGARLKRKHFNIPEGKRPGVTCAQNSNQLGLSMKQKLPFVNLLSIAAVIIVIVLAPIAGAAKVSAQNQQLDSTNYRLLDPTVDSGGGAGDSTNYSLLASVGNPTADARLESGSYALGSGFPSGIMANVPLLICAEGNTDTAGSDCLHLPNAAGMDGECGTPGCYDRGKVEIDRQNNPIDTLYLVRLVNQTNSVTYYLQSDHSISTTYDVADYMTICQLQGRDPGDTACDDSGDGNWNADLQSSNIYGLRAATQYTVSARALSGDFTETQFSPTLNLQTENPSLVMDLDIGPTIAASTLAPHTVSLGSLSPSTVATAADQIWLDLGTNAAGGMNTYVRDLNNGLLSTPNLIASASADLAVAASGFGLKTSSTTQAALGPLQRAATYNTGGADQVGGLSTSDALILFTDELSTNRGPLADGRAGLLVKAKAANTTPSGSYSDIITFTMIGNF